MVLSVFVLLFTVFITVTLIQSVRVRLCFYDEAVIDFDFFFFKLLLYPTRRGKRKKKKRKNFRKSLAKNIKRAAAFKGSLDYILKKSRLTVHALEIPINESDPARYAIRAQNISSLINITLTYLYLKLGTLRSEDDIFLYANEKEQGKTKIDATLDTTLSVALVSFFKYLLGLLGVRKVVRNENE